MKCKRTSERLSAYLDGELPPQETLAVQQHLRACARCAAELDELKRLNGVLGSLSGMVPPMDFTRRVREAAQRRPAAPIRVSPVAVLRFNGVVTRIAALVMVVAGLWFGAIMGRSLSQGRTAVVETETSESTEFDLQLDPLSAAPSGSVAEVYLAFADQTE